MIKPTSDRKIWMIPGTHNSFGLTPGPIEEGGTCPGCTLGRGGCWARPNGRKTATCYVDKLLGAWTTVRAALEYNTELLREADHTGQVFYLLKEFLRFYHETTKKRGELNYRIHWSGDVFDDDYAQSLREAIMDCSFINFWGYTRSLATVPVFAGITNLQWYLSLDPVNFEEGYKVYQQNKKYGNIHFAVMADEPPAVPGEKFYPCPVDDKRMPLVGACQRCRLCLKGRNIWFKRK